MWSFSVNECNCVFFMAQEQVSSVEHAVSIMGIFIPCVAGCVTSGVCRGKTVFLKKEATNKNGK